MSTALKILKALQKRNKTVSELSRELKISKATVFYHVRRLRKKGLIARLENGNKFVYYSLTEKGRELIRVTLSMIVSALASYILALISNKKGEILEIGYGRSLPFESYSSFETNFYVAFLIGFVFIFITTYVFWRLLEKA